MMSKKNYLLVILVIAVLLPACDFLDYDEISYNQKEDVFEDFNRTKNFLTGIYSRLPVDFNSIDGAIRASATDEAEHVWDLSDVQKFNTGNWSAISPLDGVWESM